MNALRGIQDTFVSHSSCLNFIEIVALMSMKLLSNLNDFMGMVCAKLEIA